MKLNKWYLVISIILVGIVGVYSLYVRDTVISFFNGTENVFLDKIISVLYPRYYTDKFRFNVDFFVHKCDQIVVRLVIVYLLGSLFLIFKSNINKWFNSITANFTLNNINYLNIYYFVFLLWICKDWYFLFNDLYQIKAFYKPILLFSFSFKSMPNILILNLVLSVLYLATLSSIFNIYRKWSSVLSIICFVFLQMVFFSFEKIDHGYVPFTFLGLIICIVNFNQNNQLIINQLQKIAQVMLVACYYFAGLEKILSSGFTWFEAENFKVFMLMHKSYFTDFVVNNRVLCAILPIGAMLFQLLSPLALYNRKMSVIFIVFGFLFHFNTWLLFGVGALLHPWVVCYIVFWNKKMES
ncbi:MAG: hypothetical protein RLZZ175_1881 [Bacteroidota bacterium]|jgi:hypothetical protein